MIHTEILRRNSISFRLILTCSTHVLSVMLQLDVNDNGAIILNEIPHILTDSAEKVLASCCFSAFRERIFSFNATFFFENMVEIMFFLLWPQRCAIQKTVSFLEFASFFQLGLSDEQTRLLLEKADKNHDGVLDYNEFSQMVSVCSLPLAQRCSFLQNWRS